MSIKLIYAVSLNNVIGKDNTLPWKIPEDLRRFKAVTLSNYVIMGRKTWESLPENKLPGRMPIVITSRTDMDNVMTFNSVSRALQRLEIGNEIYIIGGTQVLQEAVPIASEILLTRVYTNVVGEHLTYGPILNEHDWKLDSQSEIKDYQGLKYQFCNYRKS